MKSLKSNRLVIFLLSSISLFVWGIILYQLIWGVNYDPSIEKSDMVRQEFKVDINMPAGYSDSMFVNLKSIRNPFAPKRKEKRKKKIKKIETKEKPKAPDFKYIGFITDPKGNLALLSNANNETFIKREGEFINEICVKSISRDKVTISHKGHIFDIKIMN